MDASASCAAVFVHGVDTWHLVTETAKCISQANEPLLEVIPRHLEKLKLPESASHMQNKAREIFLLSVITWGTFPFISSRKFILEHILHITSPQKAKGKRTPGISHNACCRGHNYFNSCYLCISDRIADTLYSRGE